MILIEFHVWGVCQAENKACFYKQPFFASLVANELLFEDFLVDGGC